MTHEKLQKMVIQLTSKCLEEADNNSHLFLHFKVTDTIWQVFLSLAAVKWAMFRVIDSEELEKCSR